MPLSHSPQKDGNTVEENSVNGNAQAENYNELQKLNEIIQTLLLENDKLKSQNQSNFAKRNTDSSVNIINTPAHNAIETFKVSTKVPPFYSANPDLWFFQIEAQFRNNHITGDQTKYDTVIGSLDPQYLAVIAELIRNPPAINKYESLKAELIKEYAQSQERRLTQLLQGIIQGDKRPSALLREMREISKGMITEQVLETLWSSKLDTTTRSIISTLNLSLTEKASAADKIQDICGLETSEINFRSNVMKHSTNDIPKTKEYELSEIKNEMAALTRQYREVMDILKNQNHRPTRSRSLSRSSSRSVNNRNNSDQPQYEQCWYHYKFGHNAKKCKEECKYYKRFNEKREQSFNQSTLSNQKN